MANKFFRNGFFNNHLRTFHLNKMPHGDYWLLDLGDNLLLLMQAYKLWSEFLILESATEGSNSIS